MVRVPRWQHPEDGLVWTGLLIWHMAFALLAGLAGQVAMLPRIEALQAQLEEREETAANLWLVFVSTHCALKEAELHIQTHLWPDVTWFPGGDESQIPCPTDPAPSPLFASAEEAAPEGEGSQPEAQERAAAAGRRGAQALVAAGSDAGR